MSNIRRVYSKEYPRHLGTGCGADLRPAGRFEEGKRSNHRAWRIFFQVEDEEKKKTPQQIGVGAAA